MTGVPLGDLHATKIVAQVLGVMDEKASPPVITVAHSETGEEIIVQLLALLVPFTLPKTAQLPSSQHEKSNGSASWKSHAQSTVPVPSAWQRPSNTASHIEGTQGGHGLKVQKSLTASSNAESCARDGDEYRGDTAPVCCVLLLACPWQHLWYSYILEGIGFEGALCTA